MSQNAALQNGKRLTFARPEEMALSIRATALVFEDPASTALLSLTHSIVSRAVAAAGSDAQKDRYLQGMVQGKQLGAIAVSEPLSLQAKADGDEFVIDGSKALITAAGVR